MFPSLGDDRNWDRSDADFEELEKNCKIKIPDWDRKSLKLLLLAYLQTGASQIRAPRSIPIFGCAKKVTRHSIALGKLVRAVEFDDAIDTLRVAIARQGFLAIDLLQLRRLLDRLASAVTEAEKVLADRTFGASGPDDPMAFRDFVWQLSYIYEKCGGTVSAAYSQNVKLPANRVGARYTPFVRFVEQLISWLPTELHLPAGGLGEVVNRSLRAKPKGWVPSGLEKYAAGKIPITA